MKITAANWTPVLLKKVVMVNLNNLNRLKFLLSSLIMDTSTTLNTMMDTALFMKSILKTMMMICLSIH